MSSRDKKLLIILVGIVFLALSYFLVFQRTAKEVEMIESENNTLRARVNELTQLAEMCPIYEADMAVMKDEIQKIINKFPSLLKEENGIMDVVELEEKTNAFVSSLTLASPLYIEVGAPVTETVMNEDGTQSVVTTSSTSASYQLYDVVSSVIFEADYEGVKNVINFIKDAENPMSVELVNLSFDNTTGLLSGSMEYNSFYLAGQEKPYVEAPIPVLPHGVDNIFGNVLELPAVEEVTNEVVETNPAVVETE